MAKIPCRDGLRHVAGPMIDGVQKCLVCKLTLVDHGDLKLRWRTTGKYIDGTLVLRDGNLTWAAPWCGGVE